MKVNHNKFKEMIDRASAFVSKTDSRKMLQYIKVDVSNGEFTVVALDGYKGIRSRAKINTSENISFFMLPIKLKNDKQGNKEIEVQVIDKVAIITVITGYGAMEYKFQQIDGEYLDINKVIPTREEKQEISFDANLLSRAIKPFCNWRINPMHFFIGKPNQPTLITNQDDVCDTEIVVLPTRTYKE